MDSGSIRTLVALWHGRARENGGNISTNCPLAPWRHGNGMDRNPSFSIKVAPGDTSPCYCWSCDWKGNLITLARELVQLGGKQYDDVAAYIHHAERSVSSKEYRGKRLAAPGMILDGTIREVHSDDLFPEEEYEPYAGRVPSYALARGLTLETCRVWALGHDPWRKRLLFPVRDYLGRLCGVSGRVYVDGCIRCGRVPEKGEAVCVACGEWNWPKYRHSTGMVREMLLYGEHMIDDRFDFGIVSEGNMDPLALWQLGYPNCVCPFGTKISTEQMRKLHRFFKRLVVIPDADEPGEKMWTQIRDVGKDYFASLRRVDLPEGEDPASMLEKGRAQEVCDALGAISFVEHRRDFSA
jgi:hypothetical protein